MKRGHLSEYFEGVAVKTLSIVDATPSKSHQHEIGTTADMRRFLGAERCRFYVTYLWLGGEQESVSEEGSATHYDTRENQPRRRPEWRLYYPSNPVTEIMSAGDTLFIAKRPGTPFSSLSRLKAGRFKISLCGSSVSRASLNFGLQHRSSPGVTMRSWTLPPG